MEFTEFGLDERLLRAVSEESYVTATPVQAQAIPLVLAGRDVMGCAQTGTGKTAAFALPILNQILKSVASSKSRPQEQPNPEFKNYKKGQRKTRVLILAPTRELAAQIGESIGRYAKYTAIRQTVVFGGVPQAQQLKKLSHGVDVLVATPGRLLDLLEQNEVELSYVETLVLDEADRMLDLGFLPDVQKIVSGLPSARQTLMFTATMPNAVQQLVSQWLKDPASVEVAPNTAPIARIEQSVHFVDPSKKPDLLVKLLKDSTAKRTLVFCRTRESVDKITKRLRQERIKAVAIHGEKSQIARRRAILRFKSEHPPVMVATDVAARGLDVPNVSLIVNLDLPDTSETYVHRIGRTARAGAHGIAVSFCSPRQRGLLEEIERMTGSKLRIEPTLEGFEPSQAATKPKPRGRSRSHGAKKPHRPRGKAKAGTSSKARASDAAASSKPKPQGPKPHHPKKPKQQKRPGRAGPHSSKAQQSSASH